jgi:hypothetical protein
LAIEFDLNEVWVLDLGHVARPLRR